MSIYKYDEFLTEKQIYNLILESKLNFSQKFNNILSKIADDKVANELIKLMNNDMDINYNYIDITDDKSQVSFIPDRRAQNIIQNKPEIYKVIEASRCLTHSSSNDKIFAALGYDKEAQDRWSPSTGTTGKLIAETKSTSGRTYCLFEEYNVENPRYAVINKEAIELSQEYPELWTTNRNPIAIGRLARAILTAANVSFVTKDIEDFVNKYKATFDFIGDALKRFDIVKGDKISYWYNGHRYEEGDGTLNNSCMAYVEEEYFDIYTQNSQVSLVILYDDNGKVGEKYRSDKIKGRAILWECTIDGTPIKFMDRIYTVDDCDVDLFKQFAQKNGWWYKTKQNMENTTAITDGTQQKRCTIIAKLDSVTFDYYPYMDTLCFLNLDTTEASNEAHNSHRVCRSTEGEYYDSDNW
jgi:hypothetical protein